METIYANGWQEYQWHRRCGRLVCRCAHGQLHGPSWYRRHTQTRQQQYVGRTLPQAVWQHLAQRQAAAAVIRAQIAQLAQDQAVLTNLLAGTRTLTSAEQRRLIALGSGHLLPPERVLAPPGEVVSPDTAPRA